MNTLTFEIARICEQHRTAEKWLIAPSLRVGHQWVESVARAQVPVVNVRVKTFKSMAMELAAPELAARSLRLASSRAGAFLVDRVLRTLQASTLKYLADVDLSPQLAETTLSSITAIRLADLQPSDLTGKQFEVARKGDDLVKILEEYQQLLETEGLVDYASVLRLALRRLSENPECLNKDVLVLVPQELRFSAMESRLLECIPQDQCKALPFDAQTVASDDPPAENDRQLLRWLSQPAAAPAPLSDGSVRIIQAVGEVNEVRAALRSCLADGIPWDKVELLHTDPHTYVPLIHETLLSVHRDGT